MDLTSYAELAVRLVNSSFPAYGDSGPLGAADAFGLLTAGFPALGTPRRVAPATPADTDALRSLREELAAVFVAAATGRDDDVAARLNAILARCPVQPELVRHDDSPWHLHLAAAGSAADRYAAGAAVGLSLVASQPGPSRLGVCSIASCQRVFIDTSSGRSRRYCAEHGTSRTNVTAIRARTGRTAAGRADTAVS